jgi:cobalt-zinc-cadmium efflux system membrane fusion protein
MRWPTCVLILIVAGRGWVLAHEGHAPLPTRGASVDPATGIIRLSREAAATLDVKTVELEQRDINDSWFAYAKLTSPWNGRALVSSVLSGRIVSLLVRPGETVAAGQVLAEVDSQELHALRQELLTAQNEVALATQLHNQLETVVTSGAVAGQKLTEARSTLRKAENALTIARQKWISLGLPSDRLSQLLTGDDRGPLRLTLTSPLPGTVIHSDLSVGKIVDPKEHLFEVVAPATLWLQIDVLEKDLRRVAVGQTVELSLTAYPGRTWPATIDKLGEILDPVTHVGVAWATLQNPLDASQQLLPGMTGQVRLRQTMGARRLVVPQSAVLMEGAERYVLVEQAATKDGFEFKKQSIVLGQRVGDAVEVRGGALLPGDRVATQGSHELSSFFEKGSLKLSRETARDIGLEVQSAGSHAIAEVFEADAMVDVPPDRRSVVASPLSGIIHRILVDRAQPVRQGDVIAEVRSQDLQSLQLDLLQAELEARLQSEVLSNLQAAASSLSKRQLLEVQTALRNAQIQQDSLTQQLRTVGLDEADIARLIETGELVQFLSLRAPIDGVVVRFDKLLGHVVVAEEPLFEIHDLSRSYIQAFVAERDAGRVTIGQHVRVRLVAAPGMVLSGQVVRTGQVMGDLSRTLSVWIETDSPSTENWPHNLLARVSFIGTEQFAAVAVPRSALVEEGTRSYVFVQQPESVFERRAVVIGRRDDRFVEIVTGLKPGENVAVSGVRQLQTGYAAIR